MAKKNSTGDLLLLAAIIFSDFAALGYELLWTRLLSLVLGGEVLGILGVLAGFFGGMVLGAYGLSRHARRSANPIRVFIILEAITAVYGVLSPHLIYKLSNWLPLWLGPVAGDNNSFTALLLTVLIAGLALLPATFCIGANFAYLVEARHRVFKKQQQSVNLGRIYAANTLGATLGVFSAVYWIMPLMGLAWSGVCFAACGFIAIGLAWLWGRKNQLVTLKKKVAKNEDVGSDKIPARMVYAVLFMTGLAAIGLEIAIIHFLKQILQNTVYTFANILSVYLLGTAIGAWGFQWLVKRFARKTATLQKLPQYIFMAMTVSVLLVVVMLCNSDQLLTFLSPDHYQYTGHLMAEILLSGILFLIPTLIMGALFSYLMSLVSPAEVGRAYGINTLGATLAPFVFGLLMIPLGSFFTFLSIWGLYFLVEVLMTLKLSWPKKRLLSGLLTGLLLMIFFPKGPDLIKLEEGWVQMERKEGLMGTVIIAEAPERVGPFNLPMRTIQVNNHFRMGGGASFIERRMGNLPLLIANDPQNVLFLGLGTGTTMGVSKHYPVKKIVGVEIVPEIGELLPWFSEHQQQVLEDPRVQIHTADARRFVVASKEPYDLIIADLFHPARDGAGLLFTVEHFYHLKDQLTDQGMLAQWLPLHQFDQKNLKTVIRSFLEVFPETHAFIGGYNAQFPLLVLLGTKAPLSIDLARANDLLASSPDIQMAFENLNDLLASYFTDPQGLSRFADAGPFNRDLNPSVLFNAPRSIYIPEIDRAQENLRALMAYRQAFTTSLFRENFAGLVISQQTWKAAGLFLEGNQYIIKGDRENAWKKYISSYVEQPDFSPARGKLFQAVLDGEFQLEAIAPILREDHYLRLRDMR